MTKEKAAREEKMVEKPTPKKKQRLITGAEEIRKLSEDYEYKPSQSAKPTSPEEQAASNPQASDQEKK